MFMRVPISVQERFSGMKINIFPGHGVNRDSEAENRKGQQCLQRGKDKELKLENPSSQGNRIW